MEGACTPMKYHFFIDNFRGFSNTFIPVTDVNFLVGENSTGKTSVLGLIKLFANSRFLVQPELGDEHVTFGHFSDMVSAHSPEQSYFHIGSVRPMSEEKNGDQGAVGTLCTFKEDKGLPRLSSFTLCEHSRTLSLRYSGNHIRYKVDTHPIAPTTQDIVTTLLPKWKEEHLGAPAAYEKLDTSRFTGKMPLIWALGMINTISNRLHDMASKKKKSKHMEFTFRQPDISFGSEVVWIAPIRTKPRRTYDELTTDFSPEGTHTPYLIRRILRSKKAAVKFNTFIHEIGQSSGLFQDVLIKNFGREVTAPFEVNIVLDAKALNLNTVGYGVSQSLPVLVEVLDRPRGTWFAIQQPEVHLHPRAQAALGDVFFEMAAAERKRFLVETHSDFTIDRFRMNYRKARSKKPDSQILFFERRDKHNVVTPLSIDESGDLPADQPESYRDFFVREELRLLGDR